jgi:hypothetical protein
MSKTNKPRAGSRVMSKLLGQATDVAAGVIISSVVVSSGHYHLTTHHEDGLNSLPHLQFRHTLTGRYPLMWTGGCELWACRSRMIPSWNRMRISNLEYQQSLSSLHSHLNGCLDWSRVSFLVPLSSASSFRSGHSSSYISGEAFKFLRTPRSLAGRCQVCSKNIEAGGRAEH